MEQKKTLIIIQLHNTHTPEAIEDIYKRLVRQKEEGGIIVLDARMRLEAVVEQNGSSHIVLEEK